MNRRHVKGTASDLLKSAIDRIAGPGREINDTLCNIKIQSFHIQNYRTTAKQCFCDLSGVLHGLWLDHTDFHSAALSRTDGRNLTAGHRLSLELSGALGNGCFRRNCLGFSGFFDLEVILKIIILIKIVILFEKMFFCRAFFLKFVINLIIQIIIVIIIIV